MVFVLFSFNVLSQISKEDSLTRLLHIADEKQKMEVLNELIRLNTKKAPEKAIKFGERFMVLSEENSNDELKAGVLFNLAIANIYLREYENSKELLDEAIKIREALGDELAVSEAKSQLAFVFYRTGDIDTAYRIICEAQVVSEKYDNKRKMATDMYRRGVFAKKTGRYEEAILYYNKAIDVYKLLDNEQMVGQLLGNIGNVFINLNLYDKALKYHFKALAIHVELGDSASIAGVLNDIGNDYYKLKNTDLALDYYFRAYEMNKKTGNDIWQAYNLSNIGTIYSETEKYDEAIDYLQKSILLKEKSKDTKSLAVSYSSLGDTYLEKGDYREALKYLLKSQELAEKAGIEISVTQVLKKIALVYSLLGNSEKAYEYQVRYSIAKDSVFSREKIESINEIQEKYESIEREKEIQQLKFDKEMQGKRQVMLVILILSIVVFSALIALNFMIKRRKDKQILVQKDILHKKEQDLAKLELEQTKLKEHELQNESDFKSRQLTTHALNMMQKSKLLQELQADINELGKKSPTELKPEYRRINQLINRNLKSDNEWDVFKMYFEQVNKNFYSSLLALSPELTNYDLRLCALIKLNLNIKETASVLNIAPNSIKSARYRLRKKLNMEQEDDLYEFVRDIG
jgi:tetratricopeptide (TPR) repeat protein